MQNRRQSRHAHRFLIGIIIAGGSFAGGVLFTVECFKFALQ